jgi:hypothetical protein
MSESEVSAAGVVAVLLADGWHRIVPGSFSVGLLGYGAGPDPTVPGFRFAEAEAGRPYQPTTLAGPLRSIIAVREVTPAVRRVGDPDRAGAARGGQRAVHGTRLRAGRHHLDQLTNQGTA